MLATSSGPYGGGTNNPRGPRNQRPVQQPPQAAAPAPTMTVTNDYSANSSGQYSGGGGGQPKTLRQQPQPQPQQPMLQAPQPTNLRQKQQQNGGGGKHHHKGKGGGKGKSGPPSIQKYLAGDSVYQDQISQLIKQLQDFTTNNKTNRSNVRSDFATALHKMASQRGLDLKNSRGDYASRGLLNSGLYVKSVGDYNKNYQQNVSDLSTDEQRSLADLLQSLQQYRQETSANRQNARQDAIRRRAEKYGIRG